MLGVKSVDWIGCVALGCEGHIRLNSDCLRQRVVAAIEKVK